MVKNLILSIIAIAILAGCSGKKDKTTDSDVVEAIPVKVQKLEKTDIARTLDYAANLEADKQVFYAPAATGRIEKIYVEVGDQIKKGQVLVEMDKTQLVQAEVQLKNLETEYNRAIQLNETGSISKQAYDAAVTQYEVAKANVEFLKENTQMLAPFDGVVTGKYFEDKELYTGASFGGATKPSIIAIEKIDPVKAYVSLSEQYYLTVKPGTKVELKNNIYPDQVFEGKVSIVYPSIDPASRTFTVEVKIPNKNEALRPGMTQEERLRAVYDYAKETFSYRGAENVETGSTGWELGVAKTMLTDRKGNCYSWAAAFTYLSRKVGYPSNAIAGESISEKGNRSIHAWTEIEFDGTPYTFDPQIEAVYAANYGINYDLYKKAYGTTPITYVKPEIQEPEEPETPEPDSKLSDILDIVYDGVESPNTAKIALNSENEKYYLGVEGLDYRAGIGSDALVIAIPHSVVLIEMNEGADIEAAKKSIKENADGRKWICVGVSDEDIRVESAGNYILLVMADNSEEYIANFSAHAEEIAAM